MRYVYPTLIALALSLHGLRSRSLAPSGALAAFIVGFGLMSVEVSAFGITLIVFYLIGSRATKYGKERKMALEEGHEHEGGGMRNAWQVS